jgi:methionyl aminopeptidase
MEPRATPARALRHGAIALRTAGEMEAIRAAGGVVDAALREAAAVAQPGRTTLELDQAVRAVIAAHGAEPAFAGYPNPAGGADYPAACCTSVNHEVVHGIPGTRRLVDGDDLSIDVGVRLDGWHADAAVTVAVGNAAAERVAFVARAREVLRSAIALMEPGRRWSDVAAHMQRLAADAGHGMVDGWMGHGIGRAMHEAPQVPCMVSAGLREHRDFTLLPGMVLAVEPILVMGAAETPDAEGCIRGVPTGMADDGWTVLVADGLVAAHVEHTVGITRHGPVVLASGPVAGARTDHTHGGARR